MYSVWVHIKFIRGWFYKRVYLPVYPGFWLMMVNKLQKLSINYVEFEMSCYLSHILDHGFSKMLLRWRYFLYPCNVKRDWIIGSRWPNSYHNPVARMSRIYVAFFLGKSKRKTYANIYHPFVSAKITEFVFFLYLVTGCLSLAIREYQEGMLTNLDEN